MTARNEQQKQEKNKLSHNENRTHKYNHCRSAMQHQKHQKRGSDTGKNL